MDFLTTTEVANKWGISTRRVTVLCNEGRIEGAKQYGHLWLIPDDVEKPKDERRSQKKK